MRDATGRFTQGENGLVIVPHRFGDFHARVELDRGRDGPVSEKAADHFMPAGVLPEKDVTGEMAELMCRHPHPDMTFDQIRDLAAEQAWFFVPGLLAGKQPIIGSPDRRRPDIVNVAVQQVRNMKR